MDKITQRQKQFSNALENQNRNSLYGNIQASYNVHCVSAMMFHYFYGVSNSKEEFQNLIKNFIGNFKNGMGSEFDKDLEIHQKLFKDGQDVFEVKNEDARGIYDILMKECLEPRLDNFMRHYDVHDAMEKHKEKEEAIEEGGEEE